MTTTNKTMYANYRDELNNLIEIEADSVEALAEQLPEDYAGPSLRVTDEPGFTRGWIRSRTDWQAE